MRFIAIVLLLIAGSHYTHDLLAELYPDHVFASRAIFYAEGGIERSVLYLLVWALGASQVERKHLVPLSLCCLWGVCEGLEIAFCRLAWGLQQSVPDVRYDGICGALTGMPFYWLGLGCATWISIMALNRLRGKK